METKKEKKYETVAKFTEDNCTFTIKQPIVEDEKARERYLLALAKCVYGGKK